MFRLSLVLVSIFLASGATNSYVSEATSVKNLAKRTPIHPIPKSVAIRKMGESPGKHLCAHSKFVGCVTDSSVEECLKLAEIVYPNCSRIVSIDLPETLIYQEEIVGY